MKNPIEWCIGNGNTQSGYEKANHLVNFKFLDIIVASWLLWGLVFRITDDAGYLINFRCFPATRGVHDVITAFLFLIWHAADVFPNSFLQITQRSGALGEQVEMELLQVEFLFEIFFGVISELDNMQLANHVGGRLAWVALVTGDVFLHAIACVPDIVREEPEGFGAIKALVVQTGVYDKT